MGGARAMSNVLFDTPGPKAQARHRVLTIITVAVLGVVLAAVVWRLHTQGQLRREVWEPFVTPRLMIVLLEGLWATVTAAAAAIALALVFGLLFGIAKLSEQAWIRWPAWVVVEFFRAVPLLMLILVIFFVYQTQLGSYWSLVFGLTLYNGAVLAEVFRAGINAVPPGQREAGLAIGLRKSQVTTIILLPQAVRIMLPAIISQCIIALKDTSLGYIILAPGLTFAGQLIWGEFDNRLATGLVLAAIYITVNSALTWLAGRAQYRVTRMRET
jgi:glutamate transport system permease protein